MVRLLTEEASQHKRNSEDEILAAFQALDTDKKGYLEQVLLLFSGFVSPSTHLLVIVSFPTLCYYSDLCSSPDICCCPSRTSCNVS